MRFVLGWLLPVMLAAVLSLGAPLAYESGHSAVASPSAKSKAPAPKAIQRGHVYLLRGLGNIWSRGIDSLAEQLTAKGVRLSVHNHRHWKELADELASKYRSDKSFAPIILIGHSLGADANVLIARRLGEQGIPVRLMVSFDRVAEVGPVSGNVQEVLNFYKGATWGKEMVPGKTFKGKLENVDLRDMPEIGHLNIDKNPELQARVIGLVMETLTGKKARSASN